MTSCDFCDIATGTGPATIVREWPDAVAFLPRADAEGKRGCADGHILVIPRVHVRDFASDPMVSAVVMARMAELADDLGDCHAIFNRGVDADQTVFHLHGHVVPRRAGDGLRMPWN